MAYQSFIATWGPPITGGLFTVGAALIAYLGTKRLERGKQQDAQFRKVYAPVLEDVVLFLNYHSLWRDHSEAYDTSAVRFRILHHVKTHLGEFGPKVVSAYLTFNHSSVRDNLRGGEPNHIPIFWRIIDEAYGLIKGSSDYDDSFKKQMEQWCADYFLWCMLGRNVLHWHSHIQFVDWLGSYDALVQRHETDIITWLDHGVPHSIAPPECFIRAVTANKDQADKLIAFMRGDAQSPQVGDR